MGEPEEYLLFGFRRDTQLRAEYTETEHLRPDEARLIKAYRSTQKQLHPEILRNVEAMAAQHPAPIAPVIKVKRKPK